MSRKAASISSVIELSHEGRRLSEVTAHKQGAIAVANQAVRCRGERNVVCEVDCALCHGDGSACQQHKEWNQFLHIVCFWVS
jgi:hypothetical protein